MAEPERTNVLQFMSVRPPTTVDDLMLQRAFVHDEERAPRDDDRFPDSAIARLVVEEVFCEPSASDVQLVQKIIAYLKVIDPCGEHEPPYRRGGLASLDDLKGAYRFDDGIFRMLPDRPAAFLDPIEANRLAKARLILDAAAAGSDPLDLGTLATAISAVYDGRSLASLVFAGAAVTEWFRGLKRAVFDALYILYILRRQIAVDLAPVAGALATLHTLEWLAADRFLTGAASRVGALQPQEKALLGWLEERVPELRPSGLVKGAPPKLVDGIAALRVLLGATPVIHPIFALLHRFRTPFNPIRPVGIGDLKVVKQWLVEYLPGEISHVATVLKGEINERTTRHLRKTEEQFAFSSERSQEISTDTQSTDKLELKREAESVVKTDLQARAEASLTYKPNMMIQIGASAGFAYSRSAQDSTKTAQQLAREVVEKAVSRIQTRTTEQRSITKVYEDEETVKHAFANNQQGAAHINGFYRFVDKRYKAQLFNFGKRLMFEFIVPEPAAFLVEQRLRAFEAGVQMPEAPKKPTPETLNLGFEPGDINRAKWQELRRKYDLSGLPSYPDDVKRFVLLDPATTDALFYQKEIEDTNDKWWAKAYRCRVDADGYEVRRIQRSGSIYFVESHPNDPKVRWRDRNFHNVWLDGDLVKQEEMTESDYSAKYTPNDDITLGGQGEAPAHAIRNSEVLLTLEFQQVKNYALTFELELAPSAAGLLDWQTAVFNSIHTREQEVVDGRNREAELAYQAALADYRRALASLKGTSVNALLQGGAEATNRRTIELELRRLCLAELTKEFDADLSDDVFMDMETVGEWDGEFAFHQMRVEEQQDGTVIAGFKDTTHPAKYPATKLPEARRKGRVVQFLEQAFEWEHLAYVFYPYFWSRPRRWVDMTSRADDADPSYSAFLQAGAARVLVAVSPGYDHAVTHYLASGEPWDGGEAPVIGDPLYVPIYQELRDQQDDLEGAVPEGEPWSFVIPTSLVYLDGGDPLPTFPQGGAPP